LKPVACTIASATSLIEISCSSGTDHFISDDPGRTVIRAQLTAEDNRVDILVAPQSPDHELGEIARVDELPERLARAGNGERGVVLCGGSASQDGTVNDGQAREAGDPAASRKVRTLSKVGAVDERGDDVGVPEVL
jgi:hypothetical protein